MLNLLHLFTFSYYPPTSTVTYILFCTKKLTAQCLTQIQMWHSYYHAWKQNPNCTWYITDHSVAAHVNQWAFQNIFVLYGFQCGPESQGSLSFQSDWHLRWTSIVKNDGSWGSELDPEFVEPDDKVLDSFGKTDSELGLGQNRRKNLPTHEKNLRSCRTLYTLNRSAA